MQCPGKTGFQWGRPEVSAVIIPNRMASPFQQVHFVLPVPVQKFFDCGKQNRKVTKATKILVCSN